MSNSLLHRAEKLAIQSRATLDSQSGSSLRQGNMLTEHRQLVGILEELIEHTHIRESFTMGILRHLRNIFNGSSTGSNGKRSWRRNLDQDLKTALISAHSFIHRHK